MSRYSGVAVVGAAVVVLALAGCGNGSGPEPGSPVFLERAMDACHQAVPAEFAKPVRFHPATENQSRKDNGNWQVGGYLDAEDLGVEHRYVFACHVDDHGVVIDHVSIKDDE